MEGEGLSIDMTWISTSSVIDLNLEKGRSSTLIKGPCSVTYSFVCSFSKPFVRLEPLAFTNSKGL